ncbi:MAG TPA: LPS export ABC transporter periplasmic protein LptC [Albitalea sp.]|nr:LPS export ABC transporter periplasmic protein LptC [Albitalea sp.]
MLEQVSSYLPLLLMALLALSTWWLVKNTPLPEAERAAAPLRHEPDYVMSRFVVQRFAPDGTLRAQIEGDALRHYPDNDTIEIDRARIRAIAPDGRVTRAVANRALSNGDGSEVQLHGGAHVTREASGADPAIEFRGEFLHAFMNTERVRSHLPVVVTRDGSELRGDSMDYDNLERVLQIKGRVQATFPAAVGKSDKHDAR